MLPFVDLERRSAAAARKQPPLCLEPLEMGALVVRDTADAIIGLRAMHAMREGWKRPSQWPLFQSLGIPS